MSKAMQLSAAIGKLRPLATFAIPNDVDGRAPTLDDVEWLDERPMPTQEEVDAVLASAWRDPVVEAFKAEREKLLNRMMSIAGRKARSGDMAFADALDWMAEQIIPLDAHPLVTAATDADTMRAAFVAAYRAVATQALTPIPNGGQFAPDMETALTWKVEVDKVFK